MGGRNQSRALQEIICFYAKNLSFARTNAFFSSCNYAEVNYSGFRRECDTHIRIFDPSRSSRRFIVSNASRPQRLSSRLIASLLSTLFSEPYFFTLIPQVIFWRASYFSAYGRVTVEKRCGFSGTCPESSVSWWSDECDRKSDEDSYTCTTCCTQTMCNTATCHVPTTCLLSLALIYHLSKLLNKSFTSWN